MNTVKGIIGGLIGGLIAAIPWLILYVYMSWLLSAAAIPIAMGVNFGYRKFGGDVDKKLPFIVAILSILIVCFITLVVMPMLLVHRNIGAFDFVTLARFYQSSSFVGDLIKDLIISIIFTGLGIAGVVGTVWAEVSGESDSEYTNPYVAAIEATKALTDKVKEVFVSRNALDKNTVLYKEDLDEIFADKELKKMFNRLVIQQTIKKKSKGYYWSERAEKSWFYRFITLFAKVMLVFIPIMFIIIYLAVNF